MPMPNLIIGTSDDGIVDILLGSSGGFGQRLAQSELTGKSRRHGTTRAVSVGSMYTDRWQLIDASGLCVIEDIDQFVLSQVTSLEQNRTMALVGELSGSIGQLCLMLETDATQQDLGFGNIGSNDTSTREQIGRESSNGIFGNEPMARSGNHDRIDNYIADCILIEQRADTANHLGRMQHADLDGIGSYIREDCIDLLLDDIDRNRVDSSYAKGILDGNGRDGRGSIAAVGRYGLDIGLDTGTTARITASDGKDARILHRCVLLGQSKSGLSANER